MTGRTQRDEAEAAVVGFLGDPATHGGAVVTRIDTHGSHVFLAGGLAYKLKRPVRFPYMDFSTPERRRAFCFREVDLNRRSAPGLYLGVRPVVEGAGGLSLGPLSDDPRAPDPGPAVDWVVVMRRMDQDLLLDRVAARGELDSNLARALAEAVARLHEAAEPQTSQPETGRGGAAELKAVVDGNHAELAVHGDLFGADRLARLVRLVEAALAKVARLLDRRREEGRVRLCHGDLHLRNACLWRGEPVLFDRIEFDDRIAVVDVLYDLAFLLMDLERRDLRAQGNAVLNRWLELTFDHDGLAALPLFLAVRAEVRAKVDATLWAETGDPATAAEARAYMDLALSCLDPPEPRLAVVAGLSGTGKTTLARTVAPCLGPAPGAVILRSDLLRKRLWGVGELDRLPAEAYAPGVTARVYGEICRLAGRVLDAGHAAVADAVYARPEERAAIEAVARARGLPFRAVWLEAPPDALVARVAARRDDASDASVEVVRRQLGYDLGPLAWPRVDADAPADVVAARLPALLAGP